VRTREATVPFLELRIVHENIRDAILADLADLIDSSAFVNGPAVGRFESAFAQYCGSAEAVGLSNGLDALRLALVAAGVQPGDEVVVPAMTFVATWEAVSQVGALPLPADVSETDYCVDPSAVEAAIRPAVTTILPVHLFGQLADLNTLARIAEEASLKLIEDAAQAHGAERGGRRAGGSGNVAAFSFYPGKNLGAMGDAGALTTDDSELAARVRALREHGQYRKYTHEEVGWTARLDTLQAAILLRKLEFLDGWNAQRREVAALYLDGLDGVGDLVMPPVVEPSGHVWHLFVVRTSDPEGLAAHLREHGIASGRHYPEPPHLSRAYERLGYAPGSFPVAERLARECLSLPIFPGMRESQVEQVVAVVEAWFDRA
jgi:dTDP-4-amino-4,6-dideoxygalactose transaminase